jgi:hypothetical protein
MPVKKAWGIAMPHMACPSPGSHRAMAGAERFCRFQGTREVAADSHRTLIPLRDCFLRGRICSIDTSSVIFFNPCAELRCVQPEVLIDPGFSMPH